MGTGDGRNFKFPQVKKYGMSSDDVFGQQVQQSIEGHGRNVPVSLTVFTVALLLTFCAPGLDQDDCTFSPEHQLEVLRKAEPSNPRIATLAGDCYTRLGQIERAVAILEPVQETHPDDLDLTYVLGSAMVRGGRRGDGVVLLERVGKSGKSADAYMLAGSTLLDLNEFEQARQDLDMALQLNPEPSRNPHALRYRERQNG